MYNPNDPIGNQVRAIDKFFFGGNMRNVLNCEVRQQQIVDKIPKGGNFCSVVCGNDNNNFNEKKMCYAKCLSNSSCYTK